MTNSQITNSLVGFSNDLAALVERTAGAVVAVDARSRFNSSGVHWSPGVVVTAEHALRRDEEIAISAGGERLAAELVGRDPGTDLAVLRVKDLKAPVIDKGGEARPGALAVAVGRNKESANAAFGVIGSVSGPSQTWRGGKLDQVVRVDVSLHPVGAGGAVVDAAGKLIGIATPVLSRVAVFAVPVATVERVVGALLAHGRIPQGYLGAGLQPVQIPEHLSKGLGFAAGAGLMTVSVDENGPAGKGGLLIGDLLIELNGHRLERTEGLRAILAEAVGKSVTVKIVRGGKLETLAITVGERPGRN